MANNLVYSIIPLERSSEVAQFLVETFFKDEPISTALGLPSSQVSRWFPSFIPHAIKHGMSFMVTDPVSNKIVGVSINIVPTIADVKTLSMMNYLQPTEPIMIDIAKFLGRLNADIETPEKASRVLTHIFLAVIPELCKQGIARQLTIKSLDHAGTVGINSFRVDTTSEYSFKMYSKLGYKILREIKFTDYFDDKGINIFNGREMGDHVHARVIYKTGHK